MCKQSAVQQIKTKYFQFCIRFRSVSLIFSPLMGAKGEVVKISLYFLYYRSSAKIFTISRKVSQQQPNNNKETTGNEVVK